MKTRNYHFLIILLVFCALAVGCGERYYQGKDPNPKKDITYKPADPTSPNISKSRFKEIRGKVIKISDGDTFTLIFENNFEVRIRLNGIDCPEKKQAFSNKAKDALSELIFGKKVLVKYKAKDGHGRVLGNVFVNDVNVNQELVRRGYAWHYKEYSDDPLLAKLEIEAKVNKVGLWVDPSPIPPWEFRDR